MCKRVYMVFKNCVYGLYVRICQHGLGYTAVPSIPKEWLITGFSLPLHTHCQLAGGCELWEEVTCVLLLFLPVQSHGPLNHKYHPTMCWEAKGWKHLVNSPRLETNGPDHKVSSMVQRDPLRFLFRRDYSRETVSSCPHRIREGEERQREGREVRGTCSVCFIFHVKPWWGRPDRYIQRDSGEQ